MFPVVVLMLLLLQSSADSPTQRLDEFFKNKRNEVLEKGISATYSKQLKDTKKQYIQYQPKQYKMNMEDSVETRWSPLCDEYTTNYTAIYNYLNDVLESTNTAALVYGMAMEWFNQHVTDPYKSEMEYFATCTKVPLQGVVIVNLMEIFLLMGCTSVVCADKKNKLVFGKNLDLWLADIQNELRSVMIKVEYTSGNDLLFSGDSFFGYSGIIAGVTPDAYSVAVNSRYTNATIFNSLIALANNGNLPYSWLMRNTLSNYNKYSDAVDEFKTSEIATPCYFIVGGVEYPEGVVITRNFTDSINPFELKTSYLDWYIIQTNDDWWKQPTDERRKDGIKNMELMGQKKANGKNLLFDVLSKFETINFGTVSQTLMLPEGKDSSDSFDSLEGEDLLEDKMFKRMHSIWIVKYEDDESYSGINNAQLGMMNVDDDFISSFERLWNRYVAIGISIFAATICFNFLMCIYWSAGYKIDRENNKDKMGKVIMSESELTETESSDRDDDAF